MFMLYAQKVRKVSSTILIPLGIATATTCVRSFQIALSIVCFIVSDMLVWEREIDFEFSFDWKIYSISISLVLLHIHVSQNFKWCLKSCLDKTCVLLTLSSLVCMNRYVYIYTEGTEVNKFCYCVIRFDTRGHQSYQKQKFVVW